jgi:hypothetical protein
MINEQKMLRRLKREGTAARSEQSDPLCRRIMEAIDEKPRPSTSKGVTHWRVALGAAVCVAATLLLGLGIFVAIPNGTEPRQPTVRVELAPPVVAVARPPDLTPAAPGSADEQPADSLFSPTATAVQTWTAFQEAADPLAELNHDARLAGQMVLAALPVEASAD